MKKAIGEGLALIRAHYQRLDGRCAGCARMGRDVEWSTCPERKMLLAAVHALAQL